jgi:type I restriction enzyme, R subunit
VGIIEAKRKHIDVSGALQQAKRYSRGFKSTPDLKSEGTFGTQGEFRIPFVFSTNGRPYLR